MAAKLVAEDGILKGLVLSLEEGEQWVIGRDPDACQLLVEDPSASRKHLICRTTPQGILVENLSTTNPVQINDEEVKEPRILQNGDAVKIGNGLFRFYAEAAAHLFKDAQNDSKANGDLLKEEMSKDTDSFEEFSNEEQENQEEQEEDIEYSEEERIPPSNEPEFDIEPEMSGIEPAVSGSEQNERSEQNENRAAPKEDLKENEQEGASVTTESPQNVQPDVAEPNIEDKQVNEDTINTNANEVEVEEGKEENAPQNTKEQESTNDPEVADDSPTQDSKSIESESVILSNVIPAPEGVVDEDVDPPRHSIFEEEPSDKDVLAEINFGLLDTGRWLLKVIGGPNNGAEFSMATGSAYVIGTDPNSCDIVFHDTSVSRQHARIAVDENDVLSIEDLKSRNGTLVDGEPLQGKQPLAVNTLISLGTTTFIVFDREGEMQTIISPLMPSIVKVLQKEEAKKVEEVGEMPAAPAAVAEVKPVESNPASVSVAPIAPEKPTAHPTTTLGAFILMGILTGLFVIVGIGTSTLFKSEPVTMTQTVDPTQILDEALSPFSPNVKYTFNKSTGRLLLVGHVLTASDRNQLLYTLQGMKFIKNLDDSGIVIDEYVWHEINQILAKNPNWKGITVQSPSAGHFILSGYLKTRGQAEQLAEYMTNNFPYLDLLEKRVIVDEDTISSINNLLDNMGFRDIKVRLDSGDVSLSGKIPIGKSADIDALIAEIRSLPGIRNVRNLIAEVAPEQSMVNISDKYEVSGVSNQGGTLNVVINGRILSKGDVLDGMTITSIQANVIFLEKEGVKYRIDYSK